MHRLVSPSAESRVGVDLVCLGVVVDGGDGG